MRLTPKEARAGWVKALRSGKYTQTHDNLRDEHGYCCLGVACDLYMKIEGGGKWRNEDGYYYFFLYPETSSIALPLRVRDWLGLSNTNPVCLSLEKSKYCSIAGPDGRWYLAGLNDKDVSFDEIADLIEQGKVELEK